MDIFNYRYQIPECALYKDLESHLLHNINIKKDIRFT